MSATQSPSGAAALASTTIAARPRRDSYAGTLYGLMHAYDLVGADDAALREQIRGDVLVLAGRLVRYGWSFPRPLGNVRRPSTSGSSR
jgi:hypothetical protein